jgi:hypothetical protein
MGAGKPQSCFMKKGLPPRCTLQFGLAISAFFVLCGVSKSPHKAQKSTHGLRPHFHLHRCPAAWLLHAKTTVFTVAFGCFFVGTRETLVPARETLAPAFED